MGLGYGLHVSYMIYMYHIYVTLTIFDLGSFWGLLNKVFSRGKIGSGNFTIRYYVIFKVCDFENV
jgi:hypothetical protein